MIAIQHPFHDDVFLDLSNANRLRSRIRKFRWSPDCASTPEPLSESKFYGVMMLACFYEAFKILLTNRLTVKPISSAGNPTIVFETKLNLWFSCSRKKFIFIKTLFATINKRFPTWKTPLKRFFSVFDHNRVIFVKVTSVYNTRVALNPFRVYFMQSPIDG